MSKKFILSLLCIGLCISLSENISTSAAAGIDGRQLRPSQKQLPRGKSAEEIAKTKSFGAQKQVPIKGTYQESRKARDEAYLKKLGDFLKDPAGEKSQKKSFTPKIIEKEKPRPFKPKIVEERDVPKTVKTAPAKTLSESRNELDQARKDLNQAAKDAKAAADKGNFSSWNYLKDKKHALENRVKSLEATIKGLSTKAVSNAADKALSSNDPNAVKGLLGSAGLGKDKQKVDQVVDKILGGGPVSKNLQEEMRKKLEARKVKQEAEQKAKKLAGQAGPKVEKLPGGGQVVTVKSTDGRTKVTTLDKSGKPIKQTVELKDGSKRVVTRNPQGTSKVQILPAVKQPKGIPAKPVIATNGRLVSPPPKTIIKGSAAKGFFE